MKSILKTVPRGTWFLHLSSHIRLIMQISSIIQMLSFKRFSLSSRELEADQLSFMFLHQYFILRLQSDCLESSDHSTTILWAHHSNLVMLLLYEKKKKYWWYDIDEILLLAMQLSCVDMYQNMIWLGR